MRLGLKKKIGSSYFEDKRDIVCTFLFFPSIGYETFGMCQCKGQVCLEVRVKAYTDCVTAFTSRTSGTVGQSFYFCILVC